MVMDTMVANDFAIPGQGKHDSAEGGDEKLEGKDRDDKEHMGGTNVTAATAGSVTRGFFVGIGLTLIITCVLLILIYAVLTLFQKTQLYQKLKSLHQNRVYGTPEKFDDISTNREDQLFEEKWQTERITRKLKTIIEREFIGLKTDLTVDFDERVITVVDKIETMVEATVNRKVEELKNDIMGQLIGNNMIKK